MYLILYSFYENKNSINNLKFFIKNGVINNNDIFYIFIVNGKSSIMFPQNNNIKVLYRDNSGHDFAAWSYGLQNINYENYNYFIFLNDTVIGPYLPRYVDKDNKWYVMFCNKLNDEYKLLGLTINYFPWNTNKYNEHVQSMMFCTDLLGLNLLINNKILCDSLDNYKSCIKKRMNYIIKYEIGMSKIILQNNFKITALYYCAINNIKTGDIWYNNKYFDTTINPLETMFIKSNRISNKLINMYNKSLS